MHNESTLSTSLPLSQVVVRERDAQSRERNCGKNDDFAIANSSLAHCSRPDPGTLMPKVGMMPMLCEYWLVSEYSTDQHALSPRRRFPGLEARRAANAEKRLTRALRMAFPTLSCVLRCNPVFPLGLILPMVVTNSLKRDGFSCASSTGSIPYRMKGSWVWA